MPQRPCLKCGALISSGSYCPPHKPRQYRRRGELPVRAWRELRAQVLARDGAACTSCGATEELEAHHIVPRAEGGPDVIENLTTLCGNCHRGLHRKESKAVREKRHL